MDKVTKDLIMEFIRELVEEIHVRHSEHWKIQTEFSECDTQRCESYRERISELEKLPLE